MVGYQLGNYTTLQNERVTLSPYQCYRVYTKLGKDGKRETILALKTDYKDDEYESVHLDFYRRAKGMLVECRIEPMELSGYQFTGIISGHGANLWARTKDRIETYIKAYGRKPKPPSVWRRVRTRLGLL